MIGKRYLTGGIDGVTHGYADTTALVGFTTAFDRASNKLYERHLHAEDRSHLYQPFNPDGSFGVGYDSANRLRQYQRGVLSCDTIPYLVNPGASIQTPTTLPGAEQVRTYGLDGLGNWKTSNFTTVGTGGSTTSTAEVRQHNYLNEITSLKDNTDTPVPFSYDKNGNLLNDGVRIYQYDALNRLVQVSNAETSAVLATYAYDGLNRRIQKTIADLSDGHGGLTGDIPAGTTNYLYDGQQMAMARDSDGGWLQAYFWGQYIDELLFFAVPTETVPTTYRVLSDLLYRSVAIVTTANVVTEAYDTDAYGNTICYSGPGIDGLWFTDDDVKTNNPINTTIFTGRQFDPESQIYYYRARYYSPQIGRFISRDPLKNAERRQGPNLYWYVNNNPINMIDPSGLSGTWDVNFHPEHSSDDEEFASNDGYNLPTIVTYYPDPNDCCKQADIRILQYVNGKLDAPVPSAWPYYQSYSGKGSVFIFDAPGTNPTSNFLFQIFSKARQDFLGDSQDFITCAVCDKGLIKVTLGCTSWSRKYLAGKGAQLALGEGQKKAGISGPLPSPYVMSDSFSQP